MLTLGQPGSFFLGIPDRRLAVGQCCQGKIFRRFRHFIGKVFHPVVLLVGGILFPRGPCNGKLGKPSGFPILLHAPPGPRSLRREDGSVRCLLASIGPENLFNPLHPFSWHLSRLRWLPARACYPFDMSTPPREDWRAQAVRNMELAEEPVPQPSRQGGPLGLVLLKIALLIAMSVGLVWFAGWGFLAAPVFAAWYFFWPR